MSRRQRWRSLSGAHRNTTSHRQREFAYLVCEGSIVPVQSQLIGRSCLRGEVDQGQQGREGLRRQSEGCYMPVSGTLRLALAGGMLAIALPLCGAAVSQEKDSGLVAIRATPGLPNSV